MNGTKKQIKWANEIIETATAHLTTTRTKTQMYIDRRLLKNLPVDSETYDDMKKWDAGLAWLAAANDACVVIDYRESLTNVNRYRDMGNNGDVYGRIVAGKTIKTI